MCCNTLYTKSVFIRKHLTFIDVQETERFQTLNVSIVVVGIVVVVIVQVHYHCGLNLPSVI